MQLVLLPGMDGTGDLFADFVAEVGTKLSTQVIHYPLDRPLTYGELVAHVMPQLPAKRQFVLLGESFAGPIAIAIAKAAPPNMVGLILCASFARSPRPLIANIAVVFSGVALRASRSSIAWRFVLGKFFTPSLYMTIQAAIDKVDRRVLVARTKELAKVDVTIDLAGVRVPILYLKASGDRLVLPGSCRHIVSNNPRVEIREIDAPHFVLQTTPKHAASEILSFCKRLERQHAAA